MADYSTISKRSVHNDLDEYIGSRVKSRRGFLGISQERLGNCLGITFQQIQKYEKGINRISASSLYNIANVLSVDWSYFVEGYNSSGTLKEDGSLTYETDNMKNSDAAELLHFYEKINDSKLRKKVIDLVKAIAIAQ
jgi:transcriptional regulator with XRE-family HTH domain